MLFGDAFERALAAFLPPPLNPFQSSSLASSKFRVADNTFTQAPRSSTHVAGYSSILSSSITPGSRVLRLA